MDYFDLGGFGRLVTTKSNDAQLWFNRGLAWIYGFNHEEAVHCFEKALTADPACAMAHWGIVYSLGPNYNKPWETFEPEEKQALVDQLGSALSAAEANAAGASPGSSTAVPCGCRIRRRSCPRISPCGAGQ